MYVVLMKLHSVQMVRWFLCSSCSKSAILISCWFPSVLQAKKNSNFVGQDSCTCKAASNAFFRGSFLLEIHGACVPYPPLP